METFLSGDGANSLSKGFTGSCRFGGIPIVLVKGARQKTCEALRLRVKEVEGSI